MSRQLTPAAAFDPSAVMGSAAEELMGLQTLRWREPDSNHRSRSCEKALLAVANRRRRHERRSHLQVQVRDSDACLEWFPIAFPFAVGPRVRIRLPPAGSQANSGTDVEGCGRPFPARRGGSPKRFRGASMGRESRGVRLPDCRRHPESGPICPIPVVARGEPEGLRRVGNRTFALRGPGNPPQRTEFEAHLL